MTVRNWLSRACLGLAIWPLLASLLWADEFPRFEHVEIDPHVGKVCYAVTLADVDDDGKQDIVAVTENRVLWYRQPEWKKRIIIADQTRRDNVCIAPADIDGDGKVDFALGAGWTKVGTIQWLSRGESLDDKWHVHKIDQEPWLHRMRFADVLGIGKPQLIISPLNKTVGEGVRLTAFRIPANPKTDRWPRTLMDATLDRMHNHWHADLDRDGSIDTLTASRQGVHLITRSDDGWSKTPLTSRARKEADATGAGEVKLGQLKGSRRFIATIEPMHGTSAVVYTESKAGKTQWQRHVLDDTLKQGHAIWPADLDGDGADELIVGHREAGTGPVKGPGLYVFDARDEAGTKWEKHIIDNGGVAVEDAIAGDLTGDGLIDIVAGGRATHNVKLYINRASGTPRQ